MVQLSTHGNHEGNQQQALLDAVQLVVVVEGHGNVCHRLGTSILIDIHNVTSTM